jgi:tripartite-type tricarboxylate transporter receptor subunit TctC
MRNHLIWACAAAALFAMHAQAQTFPSKPIRIVVPFAAGGPADITARTIGPRMTELLGPPVIVDNRGGANGVIGAEAAIRSPADGYTMLLSTSSITSINMVTYGDKPPYDTLRDLQPLTPVMFTTSLIVVHPSMPTKTLKELVALMKSRPNQRHVRGSSGDLAVREVGEGSRNRSDQRAALAILS